MQPYDYIIVGSGFFGAVIAQQLHEAGKTVLVLERRDHIGGNCYSYQHEDTRIIVHKYGTHVFHTSDRNVWEYVNRFAEFNRYQHRVLTTHQGRVYSMPINLATINAFYGVTLRPSEVPAFLAARTPHMPEPRNLEEKAISLIGEDLYDAFIRDYTRKQWGCDPKELPPEIITRLPVRHSYDDAYFSDPYQGIPIDGYTGLFERMLTDIPVQLQTDYLQDRHYWRSRCHTLVYTGPIDEYFGYQCGSLHWRSVRFEVEGLDVPDYQGTSVMNYADIDVPYTRIHEPSHLHPEMTARTASTIVIREYPQTADDEPYYPVNLGKDRQILTNYQQLAVREQGVHFGGRLGEYKYYDMDRAISKALVDAAHILGGGE